MMQESPRASSQVTVSSRESAHTASQRQSLRRVVAASRVELRDLLSRRRELTDLVVSVQRENDLLRGQLQRSAAALDVGGDASQVVKRHADKVRRLHDDMRNNKIRERSTERKLKKKV